MYKNFVDSDLTEHLRILRQMSWKLHTLSGHDVEDLFSEACLQYLLLRTKYDPGKEAKFTTFIWRVVWHALVDYLRDETKVILSLDQEPPSRNKPVIRETFMLDAY